MTDAQRLRRVRAGPARVGGGKLVTRPTSRNSEGCGETGSVCAVRPSLSIDSSVKSSLVCRYGGRPAAQALVLEAPRRCVGLDDAEDLLATMAGERDDVPPVHGVLTP